MKIEHSHLPPKVDPFELASNGDPYLAYADLRAAGSLLRAGPGVWVVPRYQEVAALLRDPRLGPFRFQEARSLLELDSLPSPSEYGPANSFLDGIMVVAKSQDHARLRKAVGQAFLPRLTPELRGRIDILADALLERPAEGGVLEVISELAYPLPLMVMSDLFGIPPTHRDSVGREVLKLSKLFSPFVTTPDRLVADEAVVWLRQFIGMLFDQRLESPSDDVLSDIAVATRNRMLSREEAIDNTIFLIFAALETSTSLIATGCAALANHPEQMAKLRKNPACATAVDEFLRYDAPTQITARTVQAPLEVAGRLLSKGRVLLLLLGSANHDERQFRDPARLDIERTPNPHVSLGSGAHYCLGAGLANMEGQVVFNQLARKFSVFELAGDIVREPCATPRIYSSVPVRVRAN